MPPVDHRKIPKKRRRRIYYHSVFLTNFVTFFRTEFFKLALRIEPLQKSGLFSKILQIFSNRLVMIHFQP